MKAVSSVDCFMSCTETRKLRYNHYIDERDSEAYLDIAKYCPYHGAVVKDLECVGHI